MSSKMSGRIAVTILLLLAGVQDSVTLSSDSRCAVVGSRVTIPCKYSSSGTNTKENWMHTAEGKRQQVLKKNDRQQFHLEKDKCHLIITDVKVSDSGVYTYRFQTSNRVSTSASSGLKVTVKDDASDFHKMNCWSVSYKPRATCALTGSSVEISSYFTFPNSQTLDKSFWFIDKKSVDDLRINTSYKGRVEYRPISQNNHSMIISHLEKSDEQTYCFRFHTDDAKGRFTGRPGVSLSVTDLKVHKSDAGLNCSTTCSLPNNPTYIWYKNGQPLSDQNKQSLPLLDGKVDADSYSCAVRGHEDLRSPAVCVSSEQDQRSCWSVTYPIQSICALIDQSVDIHSYYFFPDQQPTPQVAWYIRNLQRDQEQSRADIISDKPNMTSMRLKNLTERDSGQYVVKFKHPKMMRGKSSGVILSVTGLQAEVESGSEGPRLLCNTNCSLPNTTRYVWYRNGERMSQCKSASCTVALVNGMANYSCAVEGHTSLISPPVGCCVLNNTEGLKQGLSMNDIVKYVRTGAGGLLLLIFIVFLLIRRIKAASSARTQESVENESGRVLRETVSPAVQDNDSSVTYEPKDSAVHYASVHFTKPSADNLQLYSNVQSPKPLNQEENIV